MKKIILFITILFIFMILTCAAYREQAFNTKHWAYNDILELHSKNFIKNIDNYNPDAAIIRSGFINMLLSVVISPDVIDIKGGLFDSEQQISRSEAVHIVVTALKLEDGSSDFKFSDIAGDSYIYAAYNAGIINGYPDASFRRGNMLTNAQCAAIIKRIMDKAENEEEIKLETERKFLINKSNIPYDLAMADKYNIIQTYINLSPEIRIRQVNELDYWFALKLPKDSIGLSRQEVEFHITADEYKSLLKKKEGVSIQKTRYQFMQNGRMVAVDIYFGDLEGLAVAELEFDSVEQANSFIPFAWLIKDVTSDKRYKNASLAQDGLPDGWNEYI